MTRRVAIAIEVEIPDDVDPLEVTVDVLDMIDVGLIGVGARAQQIPLALVRYEVHPDPAAVFADDAD